MATVALIPGVGYVQETQSGVVGLTPSGYVQESYSGGVSVSVTATGNAGSFGAGSVLPSASAAIAGNAGSFAQGAVSSGAIISPTGSAGSFAWGAIGLTYTVRLAGNAAVFGIGTISISGAPVNVSPAGNAGIFSIGSVVTSDGGVVNPVAFGSIYGLFALLMVGSGGTLTLSMRGAPLPATVTAYPVPGDTLLVEQSCDDGDTFDPTAVLNASVLTSTVLLSGCTHLRTKRAVGSGTTSYVTIC